MATALNFEQFVLSERARIGTEREALVSQRSEVDTKIDALDRQLAAITAYETTLAGPQPKQTRQRAPGGQGSKRDGVLAIIKQHPEGMTRGDICTRLDATDENAKMSVSNALSALIKSKEITRNAFKKYVLAAVPADPAAELPAQGQLLNAAQ